jgi:ZIP family zinc transporter
MSGEFLEILPGVLLAASAGLLGGIIALFWSPNVQARSAIQHFAAGAVLSAVASSVIPEAERLGTVVGILGGFAAGGLAMIALKWVVVRFEEKEKKGGKLPIGLAAAAGVDTLVDGALITAGFFSGAQLGPLLVAALAVELFFLTLSVGSEFRKGKSKGWQGILITSGVAALMLVGAFLASLILRDASEATIAVWLAFGSAALIYLIAEELLVEAIQAEKSLLSTAMLFAGFLVLLAFKLLG